MKVFPYSKSNLHRQEREGEKDTHGSRHLPVTTLALTYRIAFGLHRERENGHESPFERTSSYKPCFYHKNSFAVIPYTESLLCSKQQWDV